MMTPSMSDRAVCEHRFEVDLLDGELTSVGSKGGSGEIAGAQVSYWFVAHATNLTRVIFTQYSAISTAVYIFVIFA